MKNTKYSQVHIKRITLFFAFLFCLMNLGCADPVTAIINHNIKKDNEQAIQRDGILLTEHLNMIAKLRAEGDPMGDYLWARANEDKFVPNAITDTETLKKMYQTAATKGSLDAANKVGLMTFNEGGISNAGYSKSTETQKREKEIIWRKGLELLEQSTAKQCYYWGIVLDGMANRRCLKPVVTLNQVWPQFRDGFGYPKDQDLMLKWREKAASCEVFLRNQTVDFYYNRKFSACR